MKPSRLAGLTALVTGAASGIGKELATELFTKEKCHLILLDRDEAGITALRDRLRVRASTAQQVTVIPCDLASPHAVDQVCATLLDQPLDILINNAGVVYAGAFEDMSIADFERVVRVNLLAPAQLTSLLLPRLLQSADPYIVNIASVAGLVGPPGLCAYAASKFGLVGFSESLRAELSGRVTVLDICPGFVRTSIAANAMFHGNAGEPAKHERASAMTHFLSKHGSNPANVSRTIIRAIKNKRARVLINLDTRALVLFTTFFPSMGRRLLIRAYQGLRDKGVLPS